MNKEQITDQQAITIIIMFVMGSALVLPTGIKAGNDLWMAIIIAGVAVLPILTVYSRILTLFPEKDFFSILEIVFGRVVGTILSLIYIWYAFHLGVLVLRNFGEYLANVGIISTPMIVTMSCLIFLCSWIVKEGIEVMGRWSKFTLRFLLALIFVTIIAMTKEWVPDNLLPMLYNGYKPILDGSFDVFAFPFAETVVFLMLLSSLRNRKKIYQTYWIGVIIGGIVVLASSLNELLTLGLDIYSQTYFPTHNAVSRLEIGDLIERMEIIPAVSLLGGGFVKISSCLLATTKGLAKVLRFDDYRFLVTPIGILMVLTANIIYSNIMEMITWAENYWPIYSFPFQVGFPIMIWLFAEWKYRRLKTAS